MNGYLSNDQHLVSDHRQQGKIKLMEDETWKRLILLLLSNTYYCKQLSIVFQKSKGRLTVTDRWTPNRWTDGDTETDGQTGRQTYRQMESQ